MKKTEIIETQNFTMKVSIPQVKEDLRVGLMLHGWTGDEKSMWIFTQQLEEDWLLIARCFFGLAELCPRKKTDNCLNWFKYLIDIYLIILYHNIE